MENEEKVEETESLKNLKDKRQVDNLLECLLFLSKYHKRETSAQSLTFGLPIHKSSMNVDMFLQASSKIGLTTKIVKRDIPDITKLALPSVLLLEKERACVLIDYDLQKGEAQVILPGLSSGVITITMEKLQSEYTGSLIIVKPEFNFNNRIENEIIVEQPKEWFWGTLKRNSGIYKQVIIVSLFINLFILATPLFTMNVYDRVLPNNAIETLWVLFIGISIVMLFDFILKLLRSYFLGVASKRTDTIISNRIFNQLLNIKINAKPASTGQFVSRLQSFESIREFFTSATIAAVVDFPFVIIFIIVIFYIGGPLGYVTIATVVISILTSWYMQRPLKEIIEKSVKEEQIKQTTLIETVTGLEIIKSIKAQNRMRTHWDKSVNKTTYYADKGQFLSQTITFFTAFISQFSNILIVAGGVYLASEGEMTMGAIIASMILNGRVIAPVSQLVGMIIKYDKTMLSLNNLDEVMKMPVEKDNKTYISRPNLNGSIEFKDVQFSYKDQNHLTLKNINLTINQGEKVAILGKIGSGKSTLLKLIMNLYEPTKGSVLIDGVDIRQIDPVDLRNAIGSVPQEPFLFMGTIKDNITIGEQYVSDEELLRVSKIAGLNEFLGKHEAGYDLIVGERGEGLSGGERQAVTLARALISNPNILMLDEPTNSMDRQTEKMFINRVEEIVEDKTLIVVTHKTSLLQLVDRVIIVENGQVILDGPKEEVFNKMSK
ncbi:type I secretion system permease/ATPase [Malaciobacter mytili]|uniref:Type I secretion system permease/ATPase n=1 Tax=Malaciobacter mytili LMG 24559 TaxID=1032238 RepID=A0AAX2AFT2_9BACT|nr:type I secretion system permease/ATPase [Malaciobacter mytili]AXH16067.1 type I secretion system ATPase/permease, LssB family [Malaciobacter mytili LMG 24559]RXI48831.1 type I secretion system permease/ATPase [Malaciobacter mytili]RXK14989.1 type I secretion system permease/ATPase [Malaciobacter mytili LMG 24559]